MSASTAMHENIVCCFFDVKECFKKIQGASNSIRKHPRVIIELLRWKCKECYANMLVIS